MEFAMNLLISGLAVVVSSYVLPGVQVDGFLTAIVVAIVLAVVNVFVKPVVEFLTLPLNMLTLGLFSFVINALMILLVAALVPGFHVDGLLWAVVFSIVLSLVGSVLYSMTPGKKRK